jgi:hypothetical protein
LRGSDQAVLAATASTTAHHAARNGGIVDAVADNGDDLTPPAEGVDQAVLLFRSRASEHVGGGDERVKLVSVGEAQAA